MNQGIAFKEYHAIVGRDRLLGVGRSEYDAMCSCMIELDWSGTSVMSGLDKGILNRCLCSSELHFAFLYEGSGIAFCAVGDMLELEL